MSMECPTCGGGIVEYAGVGLPCLECGYVPTLGELPNANEMWYEQEGPDG